MAYRRSARDMNGLRVREGPRSPPAAVPDPPDLPPEPAELAAEPSSATLLKDGKPVRVAYRSWQGLQQALEFIDAHLGEQLTLVKIAHEARLSPYHFAHIFKRFTGIAPHQYVMRRRLARAKLLLAQTDVPILTIALELGYANQSHFSEVFHRATGVTPLTFRLNRT